MSSFRNINASKDSHIKSLRLTCAALCVICIAMFWGWKSAPSKLTIHIPPDLRSGSLKPWWEVDPANVYAYTFYIWQQLNRWYTNGEEDYYRNIYKLKPFFTPACHMALEEEYEQRRMRSELRGRVRAVSEIPGRGYQPNSVTILSKDSWITNLDLVINEQYEGVPVRDIFIRYPIRVIKADTDPEMNPWGLQIDCFEGVPQRLALSSPTTDSSGGSK